MKHTDLGVGVFPSTRENENFMHEASQNLEVSSRSWLCDNAKATNKGVLVSSQFVNSVTFDRAGKKVTVFFQVITAYKLHAPGICGMDATSKTTPHEVGLKTAADFWRLHEVCHIFSFH
jgi:hypothetical protein